MRDSRDLLHWWKQRENLGLTVRPERVIDQDRLHERLFPVHQGHKRQVGLLQQQASVLQKQQDSRSSMS
jgi:hypothetical protein